MCSAPPTDGQLVLSQACNCAMGLVQGLPQLWPGLFIMSTGRHALGLRTSPWFSSSSPKNAFPFNTSTTESVSTVEQFSVKMLISFTVLQGLKGLVVTRFCYL